MIYLSGGLSPRHKEGADALRIGYMLSPNKGNRGDLTGKPWAADNACYSRPDLYSDDWFLRWLDKRNRDTCLFAVAPDIVGDWQGTITRSIPMFDPLRALGYRPAFVAQDGQPPDAVPWDSFDCLFVGGTTAYKLSEDAYRLVNIAHSFGKWTHMGRVNSMIRYRAARAAGYDSSDGTLLAFGRTTNWTRIQAWLADEDRQPALGI